MNCEEAKKLIELYVLGELAVTQRRDVKTHLINCSRCRAIEAEYRRIVTDLRQSTQTKSSCSELERNILLTVEKQITTMRPRPAVRRARTVALAVAACLLAILVLRQLWLYRDANTTPFSAESSALVQSNLISYSIPAHARSIPTSVADSIVVRGYDIYLLREDGLQANVAAIDSRTGRQKWRSDIESYGYITANDTGIYFLAPGQSGGLDLVAIDKADGKTLWRYPQEKPDPLQRLSAPTILPGNRICWITNTVIHVLGSSDGKPLWTREIPTESLLSDVVPIRQGIYIAGTTGLYYFDIDSGEQLWRTQYDFDVLRWVRPLLAFTDKQICLALRVPTGRSRLICLNLTDRKPIWTKTIPHISYLCISGNRLYIRSRDVRALDMTNGNLLWTFTSTGCSPVTYANGCIWFVDSTDQGQLIALDERTGSKMLDFTGIRSCNAFVECDNKGYVKTHDGLVHVILFKG
jgi:outer membrane protein assembly factor BamB